jgi:hypothetical protein
MIARDANRHVVLYTQNQAGAADETLALANQGGR